MLLQLDLPDESATRRLGASLGKILRAGDVVALLGDLGAGKTTLARGLIQAMLGADEPVPSPTFTLVQTYERPGGKAAVWHFDLYRLSHPEELVELGWEDAVADGICLVEWPERAGDSLPDTALWLELTEHGDGRRACFDGNAEWAARLERNLD